MKVLKTLAALVALFVVVVLILAAMQPSAFSVSRSLDIAATPEKIAPLVNDFHHWELWSPWEKLDPNAKKVYSGAPSGTGAIYHWSGNSKAGEGEMQILSATPAETDMSLDFIKPFKTSDKTSFTFVPTGAGTHVTWTMSGPEVFMTKIFTVFKPMDKMIGDDFERGLASLKAQAEK